MQKSLTQGGLILKKCDNSLDMKKCIPENFLRHLRIAKNIYPSQSTLFKNLARELLTMNYEYILCLGLT